GDSGLGHETESRRQPMLLGGTVDVSQGGAGLDDGLASGHVDTDMSHEGEVDGQPTVAQGETGDVVPAAFDGELDPGLPGNVDCGDDIVGGLRLEDDGGSLVDPCVPDQGGSGEARPPGTN